MTREYSQLLSERLREERLASPQSLEEGEMELLHDFLITLNYELVSNDWIDSDELAYRHQLEAKLHEELTMRGLGECSGGFLGASRAQVVCRIVDYHAGIEAIQSLLARECPGQSMRLTTLPAPAWSRCLPWELMTSEDSPPHWPRVVSNH